MRLPDTADVSATKGAMNAQHRNQIRGPPLLAIDPLCSSARMRQDTATRVPRYSRYRRDSLYLLATTKQAMGVVAGHRSLNNTSRMRISLVDIRRPVWSAWLTPAFTPMVQCSTSRWHHSVNLVSFRAWSAARGACCIVVALLVVFCSQLEHLPVWLACTPRMDWLVRRRALSRLCLG